MSQTKHNSRDDHQRIGESHRSELGFTLMETTIALLILMVVGLGAASLFFYAATNTSTARDRQLAMAVAQQRIEEMRAVLFTDLTATAGTATNVTSAGRPYLVNTVITDSTVVLGQPTLKRITVRVTPQGAGPGWARNVASLFGSVTVTTARSSLLLGPNR